MRKLNCWEVKNCERHPGGSKVDELGVCPASSSEQFDGINGGKNGGRFCWKITATICDGKVQGEFIKKVTQCIIECDFFKQVKDEEGGFFKKL